MAGTYRDMYKVTNEHVENFARSFKYVGVPKWWYESTGYWGVPGTPAPGMYCIYIVCVFIYIVSIVYSIVNVQCYNVT